MTGERQPGNVYLPVKRRSNLKPYVQISRVGHVVKQEKRGLDLKLLVPVLCVICSYYIQLLWHGGIIRSVVLTDKTKKGQCYSQNYSQDFLLINCRK